jgi:predicted PurR-regulated permease PerM
MNNGNKTTSQAVEIFLRLGLLLGLLYWCFLILSPFFMPVLWGLIIAVALYPLQAFLQPKFRNNQKLTATTITIVLLAVIITPTSMFIDALADNIIEFKNQITSGTLMIPEPAESIKEFPVVGSKLYDLLMDIKHNTAAVVSQHQEQVTGIAKSVLQALIGTGLGILQIILSIIIAGVLLATKGTEQAARKIIDRLAEGHGETFVKLSAATIRNVVKGVLGVALIQTALAGAGLYLAGIPNAVIWVLICFILSIVQLGPGLVLIPCSIYLFNTGDSLAAILWTVYYIVVMFSDNILKPILLGKGAPVPMLVIFLGVVGGFMLFGFIGLFTGAIVLSIGYKLFLAWLNPNEAEHETTI